METMSSVQRMGRAEKLQEERRAETEWKGLLENEEDSNAGEMKCRRKLGGELKKESKDNNIQSCFVNYVF